MAPANTVSVTVADGWAIYHDGVQHHDGTVLTVDSDTAEHWTAQRWATPTPPRRNTP